jgi:arsenate reductase (glutaredoxin)
MLTIYGLSNCDSTKKAIAWLKQNKLAFVLKDYKVEGITKAKLEQWCGQVGWQVLLNKQSTTWRGLGKAEQDKAVDQTGAIALMLQHTSLIKRPALEHGKGLLVGFKEAAYQELV